MGEPGSRDQKALDPTDNRASGHGATGHILCEHHHR